MDDKAYRLNCVDILLTLEVVAKLNDLVDANGGVVVDTWPFLGNDIAGS